MSDNSTVIFGGSSYNPQISVAVNLILIKALVIRKASISLVLNGASTGS
jgi:hypothetical protein